MLTNERAWQTAAAVIRHLPPQTRTRVTRQIHRVLPGPPRAVEYKTQDGASFQLDLTESLEAEAYLTGRWEREITEILVGGLQPGGTFFDVGGNVGLAALTVAALAPDISVHTFEPSPDNADALRTNAALNPSFDITVVEAAVGAETRSVQLSAGAASGHHFVSEAGGTTVSQVTLDGYARDRGIERVDALKIDVEGHELEVLRGAQGLLADQRIGVIVCEVLDELLVRSGTSTVEVIDTLLGHGYVPHVLLPFSVRLRQAWRGGLPPMSGDIAFIPLKRVG